MNRIAALVLTLGLLIGCSSIESYDGVKRAPKEQIDIYSDGRQPTKAFKVVATFSEDGDLGREEKKYRKFVKRAKQLGADGIILRPTHQGGFDIGPFGGGNRASYSATAIVYE